MNQKGAASILVISLVIVVIVILSALILNWSKNYSRNTMDVTTSELKQASDVSCVNAKFRVESCTIKSTTKAVGVFFNNNSNLKIFNLILTIDGKNQNAENVLISGSFNDIVDSGEFVNLSTDTNFTYSKGQTDHSNLDLETTPNLILTNGTCPKKVFNLDCEIVNALWPPDANVSSGDYTSEQAVALFAEESATIYYTLDGSDPTIESNVYSTALIMPLDTNTTLKAIAAADGYVTSEANTWVYNINHTGYRKSIVFDKTKVDSNLTDFPALISLTDTDLASFAQSNGSDIYFTASDGETRLKREIEDYNSETGTLVAWVKVPSLSSTTDTNIYVHFGNSEESNTNDTDVWDSNFVGVWHMTGDGTTTILDSSSSTYNGTKKAIGEPVNSTLGKIKNAQNFDGTNDYINHGNFGTIYTYTAEAWIKPSNLTGTGDLATYGRTIFASSAVASSYYPLWLTVYGTEARFWAYEATATSYRQTSGANLDTSNWFHIVAVATKSGTSKVYINGVEKLSYTNDGEVNWSAIFTLGDLRPNRKIIYAGLLDEIRLSSIIRSESWIKTEYNNQNSPDDFYSVGNLEAI